MKSEIDLQQISDSAINGVEIGMSSAIDYKSIEETVDAVCQENKQKLDKSINTLNKRSLWLNFIAFFVPIWGIFVVFFDLYKYPKRAKSLFKVTLVAMIIQISFLIFCYLFLFDYIGNLCIVLFG